MPNKVKALDLPFDEAIDYFKGKVNLPTKTWRDLWQGMHARGFVVAGAQKSELLSDLRTAVDKGIAAGTTLEQFRRDFDETIAKHGWKYKGGRGWRTAVMFNTNVSVAYHAGHYKQMTDPAVQSVRPFFRYIASSSATPRPEHEKWYNLVLLANDPFWDTHYPPNGWGCKCGVVSQSAREVEQLKKEEAASGNPIKTKAPKQTYYDWQNPDTGKTLKVPEGIDPGWAYNPGKAAWGQNLAHDTMDAWKAQGAKAWETLTPGDWKTAGRPALMPVDTASAKVGSTLTTESEMESAIRKALGGDEKIFSFAADKFRYDILVNASSLARHMPPDRAPFIPFINELMSDPYEIWLSFERHKGSGMVVLRQRIIKGVRLAKDRGLLMVAQSKNGIMEAWTMMPVRSFSYLNNQRRGKLLWAR